MPLHSGCDVVTRSPTLKDLPSPVSPTLKSSEETSGNADPLSQAGSTLECERTTTFFLEERFSKSKSRAASSSEEK
ncbi:MAG: hypothetical protein KME22_13495 [Hassallia sp. WJT32-NPBG1]|nr:hypothetical protein [Hassallia sp. WJT32-NPBG1]